MILKGAEMETAFNVGIDRTHQSRVIVVEDDESIFDLINESISALGAETNVVRYSSPQEAKNALDDIDRSRVSLDMIFISIYLEDDFSSLEILDYCRCLPTHTPVVIMSTHFSQEYLSHIQELDISPILLKKPFNFYDLQSLSQYMLLNFSEKRRVYDFY